MLKKIINPIALLSFLVLSLLGLLFYLFILNKKEIAYVDNEKLFNEFKMTKELIREGEQQMRVQKAKLDSLYYVLNTATEESQKSELVQRIMDQKRVMEDFQSSYSNSNSEKIWKRINGYVGDFSKKRHYNIILGGKVNGGVFYGNPELDVTGDVLKYINKRYEGFN